MKNGLGLNNNSNYNNTSMDFANTIFSNRFQSKNHEPITNKSQNNLSPLKLPIHAINNNASIQLKKHD
jgi:hypothetical protein